MENSKGLQEYLLDIFPVLVATAHEAKQLR